MLGRTREPTMHQPRPLHAEETLLVVTPRISDGRLACTALAEAGIAAELCADIVSMCHRMKAGAGGAVVVEEGLQGELLPCLIEALRDQPPWSDFPVILLTLGGDSTDASWQLLRRLDGIGNVTVLERPVRMATLVSAAQVALRARRKQYQLRDYLIKREQVRVELARHKSRLEEEVRQRTQELEASHQQLRLKERMAAMGTLSAGLGHDMGNLLLPIRMRLDAISERELPEDVREDLEALRTSAEYLRRLSDGLRLLAQDPSEPGRMDCRPIRDWWTEVEPVCRAVLPRGVQLQAELTDHDAVPAISPHLLTQAVFNLVQNAGEVLRPRGTGRVTVASRAVPADERRTRRVAIEVRDDGPGMTDQVRARCFEPFFTTKTRGISTGLGLALVHAAITQSGGEVTVETAPGAGAAFTITLPAIDRPLELPAQESVRTVIRVSDKRLRSLVQALLPTCGLTPQTGNEPARVLVADLGGCSFGEVLEFVQAETGRSAVVLSDLDTPSPRIIAAGAAPRASALKAALAEAAATSAPAPSALPASSAT